MNVQIFHTQEELNEACADLIARTISGSPSPVLGLATGGTPLGVYQALVHRYDIRDIRFRHVTTFNLDEYVGLPENHPESYHNYMNKQLFDHVDIPAGNFHLPDGNASNLGNEVLHYDRLLEQAGPIDLQMVGIGHNGHIGFNEPDHALLSGTHVVKLTESTRQANARFFASPEEVPTHAITMGIGTILKAKSILLVVKGKDKAAIVKRALHGPISTECPASLLQTHGNLHVYLDAEAGKELPVWHNHENLSSAESAM